MVEVLLCRSDHALGVLLIRQLGVEIVKGVGDDNESHFLDFRSEKVRETSNLYVDLLLVVENESQSNETWTAINAFLSVKSSFTHLRQRSKCPLFRSCS